MNTTDFKVKTEYISRNNGFIPGKWEIAVDLGYSAVKQFSPVSVIKYPSYAKRIDADFSFIDIPPKEAILYRNNNTKEHWIVGEIAQDMIETGSTDDTEEILYGRDRYRTPIFATLVDTCLGIGLMKNIYTGESVDTSKNEIIVQSGLPEKYLSDAPELKEALSGQHSFSLKIGNNKWVDFFFVIKDSNVSIMSQPRGTLFSICIRNDGTLIPDAAGYIKGDKPVIVFDAGFGTLDIFSTNAKAKGHGATFSDLGMKRVYQETLREVEERYGISVPVSAMSKYLASGTIKKFNKKNYKMEAVQFQDVLASVCQKVCKEAVARLVNVVDLASHESIVITGGTGDAWINIIEDELKDAGIPIIRGNINDDLPLVYSNVRGYYYKKYNELALEI